MQQEEELCRIEGNLRVYIQDSEILKHKMMFGSKNSQKQLQDLLYNGYNLDLVNELRILKFPLFFHESTTFLVNLGVE